MDPLWTLFTFYGPPMDPMDPHMNLLSPPYGSSYEYYGADETQKPHLNHPNIPNNPKIPKIPNNLK